MALSKCKIKGAIKSISAVHLDILEVVFLYRKVCVRPCTVVEHVNVKNSTSHDSLHIDSQVFILNGLKFGLGSIR